MKMETETGVIYSKLRNTKDCWQPPGVGEVRKDSSLEPEGNVASPAP